MSYKMRLLIVLFSTYYQLRLNYTAMSRFDKYQIKEGEKLSAQIANINNYIDWNFEKGLDVIEKEISALQDKINEGSAPAIFGKKINLLIKLGKCIEDIHETYHFNKR